MCCKYSQIVCRNGMEHKAQNRKAGNQTGTWRRRHSTSLLPSSASNSFSKICTELGLSMILHGLGGGGIMMPSSSPSPASRKEWPLGKGDSYSFSGVVTVKLSCATPRHTHIHTSHWCRRPSLNSGSHYERHWNRRDLFWKKGFGRNGRWWWTVIGWKYSEELN